MRNVRSDVAWATIKIMSWFDIFKEEKWMVADAGVSIDAAADGNYDVSNEEDNKDYDDHEILRIM